MGDVSGWFRCSVGLWRSLSGAALGLCRVKARASVDMSIRRRLVCGAHRQEALCWGRLDPPPSNEPCHTTFHACRHTRVASIHVCGIATMEVVASLQCHVRQDSYSPPGAVAAHSKVTAAHFGG